MSNSPTPAPTETEGGGTRPAELTLRVVLLGALLSAVLSAANAYLGLLAGMTVSASIPAAVLSMGLLRMVGGGLLENNLVQTGASAGESAAAGAIFTLPALLLLGSWASFDFLTTALLVGLGGILGVLFTIPLRRALVVESELPFPEGVATAEVLRAGHSSEAHEEGQPSSDADASAGLSALLLGAAFGAGVKCLQGGLRWIQASAQWAGLLGGKTVYVGMGASPALVAVGYIVGLDVALLMLSGGLLNWLIVVPFVATVGPEQTALDAAWRAWSESTRFLGVGAMTLGGLWTLFDMRAAILRALRATTRVGQSEGDLPRSVLLGGVALCFVPLVWVFSRLTGQLPIAVLLALLVIVFGFLFCSVAAYMAGLLGSSNNPVSGVTIATILFTSLLLLFLGVEAVGADRQAGAAAAILVGTVVCTAAAIGGDNMQDLKAGHLLGATPWRQQLLQLIGVVVAALCLAPVLSLLASVYGFGAPSEEHPQALRAPQATLMASVAEGVFGGSLPWRYVLSGAGLGAVVIALDAFLRARRAPFRTPVLAVAVGIYLPLELSVPIALGGALAYWTRRSGKKLGVLAGAGLITGEALMGILLAALVGFGLDLATLAETFALPRILSSLLTLAVVPVSLLLLARLVRKRL